MSKPLSPIEQMIDKACGYDPETMGPNKKSQSPATQQINYDALGDAMLAVCDAAKAWRRRTPSEKSRDKRLLTAVQKLIKAGY